MISKLVKNRVRKFGMPPGSLVHLGQASTDQIQLSIMDFNGEFIFEKNLASIEECVTCIDNPNVTWINIRGINDPKMIEEIGRHFGLHSLVLEDVLNTGQRSKLDDYKTSLFVVMRAFFYDEAKKLVDDEQISLVLGPNYVLSFLEGGRDIFDSIRARIRVPSSRLRNSGSDYLFYALLDTIVDHHFLILEKYENEVEKLDVEIFHKADNAILCQIQKLKREVITLRKGVWPVREIISQLRRMETPLITESTKLYLHDVYDHTIQAIDTIESFRDIVSGMMEVYLSSINMRMNEIMKFLTIMATIFVPLTFIASIYGMNFDYMPELHSKHGYFFVLGLMFCIFAGMVFYFRRKKWL